MSIPDNTRSDKLLFTPGPLTTSLFVKQAMLKDLGSRDQQFIDVVKSTQKKTLAIASKYLVFFPVFINGAPS